MLESEVQVLEVIGPAAREDGIETGRANGCGPREPGEVNWGTIRHDVMGESETCFGRGATEVCLANDTVSAVQLRTGSGILHVPDGL